MLSLQWNYSMDLRREGGGSSDLINKNLHTSKATSTTEECKVYIKATYPLRKTTPDVHWEHTRSHHPVNRSSTWSFNQVGTYIPHEENINHDLESKGGIIGISQRHGTVEGEFLNANEQTVMTTVAKNMGEIHHTAIEACKESGKSTGTKMTSRNWFPPWRWQCQIYLVLMP